MTSTKYLKNSYKSQLRIVAVFNVAIFWSAIISSADFSALATLLGSISIEHGVIGLFAPIGTFLLERGSRNWFRWLMGIWSRGQRTNVDGEVRIG